MCLPQQISRVITGKGLVQRQQTGSLQLGGTSCHRCQNEGESIEQYITALYYLVESCDYGNLKEEMLRD